MDIKLLTVITILISIPVSYQQSTLSITPLNQAAVLGSDVTFQCQVTQSDALTDYISWEECITTSGSNCARISNDGSIVYSALGGDNNAEARYSILVEGSKQFNLKISGITTEDAGQYRCLSRNNAEAHYSAELVVLESKPACECNVTDNTNLLSEDGSIIPVYVSCQADYYGTQAPVVDFSIDSVTLNGLNIGTIGHMQYNITYQPTAMDLGKDLYAITKFTAFPGGDIKATDCQICEWSWVCMLPGTPDTEPTSQPSAEPPNLTQAKLKTWQIIFIVVACVIVIVIIVVVVVIVPPKRKKKQTYDESKLTPTKGNNPNEIDMNSTNPKAEADGYENAKFKIED